MREVSVERKIDYNFGSTPKSKCLSVRFLAPGIKQYKEYGRAVYLSPEVLKELAKTHQGIPVIINHQDVTFENVNKLKVGTVGRVFINDNGFTDGFGKYHEPDHWAWCDITIDSQEALELIENGWEFSTTYKGLEGEPTNPLADSDIIGGNALHLAIVKKGKYSTKTIFNNEKTNNNINNKKSMKDKLIDAINSIFQTNEKPLENEMAEDKNSIEKKTPEEVAEKASYENKYFKNTEGKKVMVNDLISQVKNYKTMEAENEMQSEDEIEIDGEIMTISQALEMIAAIAPEEVIDAAEEITKDTEEEILENETQEDKEEKKPFENSKPTTLQNSKFAALQSPKLTKLQNSKPISTVRVGKENFANSKAEDSSIKTFII